LTDNKGDECNDGIREPCIIETPPTQQVEPLDFTGYASRAMLTKLLGMSGEIYKREMMYVNNDKKEEKA
jgi:hypothetical protein